MHDFSSVTRLFEDYFQGLDLFATRGPEGLYRPAAEFVGHAGKRIRPALTLMACELFSGELSDDAYRVAAGIECFHNFTLIHDDIMDRSDVRRGKPTIHKQFGLATGVLAGDLLNIYAYKLLSGIRAAYLPDIMDLFNRTAIQVCEGQQMDMDFESRSDVTEEQYLEMIRLKTSVLLAAALSAGAITGGSGAEYAKKMYELGLNVGLAFQLKDDYLDAFGLESQIGKVPGGDIRANKKTLLAISCHRFADNRQRKTLAALYDMPEAVPEDRGELVEQVKALYGQTGAEQYTRDKIALYTDRALHILAELERSRLLCQPLSQLVGQLLDRRY